MKKLFTILWVLASFWSYAQEGPATVVPAERIQSQKNQGRQPQVFDLFELSREKSYDPFLADERIEELAVIQPKTAALEQLLLDRPDLISISLPAAGKQSIELELVRTDVFTEDFILHGTSGVVAERPMAAFYRGIIKGDPQSTAAISILGDEVKGLVSNARFGNMVLSKVGGDDSSLHALYKDDALLREQAFDCGTEDSGIGYTAEELQAPASKSLSGCVRVYFEVDYDIYLDKGGLDQVGKYVSGIFNEVALLYANENVNLEISEIRVWDRASPYNGSSSSEMLDQFQSERTSFNGDLGQLLSYQASGGIAVLRGLCHPYTRAKLSFASIRSSFNPYPTYSYTVMVVAHELGHLLGSQHTHACVWNGNNTAIDGCAGFTEGSCGLPPVPTRGGTLMSYCHITQAGIDFALGLGDQPGNVIRNFVDNASCVQACSSGGGSGGGGGGGGDDGGTDGGTCTEVTLTLKLDTYSPETSWELLDANGAVVDRGGSYTKEQANQTITQTFCLDDGCYTFTIFDAYEDGICCKFGDGGYSLTDAAGNDLGSGGEFGASQTQKFCIEGGAGDNENGDCLPIDFTQYTIDPYGGLQDIGDYELLDGGTVLKIANNAWKSIALDYAVTPNTTITFEFRSDREGEIHGIGFDDNDQISYNRTFKVYGTQGWGILNYDNYSGSTWKTYTIPIGNFYQGNFDRLFFVADHDGGLRNGTAYFRNVRIYETVDCGPQQTVPGLDMPLHKTDFRLYPNPASEELQVQFDLPAGEVTQLTVFNLFGQNVLQTQLDNFEGWQTETIPVEQLPPGTYLLELRAGDVRKTTKFTVARR